MCNVRENVVKSRKRPVRLHHGRRAYVPPSTQKFASSAPPGVYS